MIYANINDLANKNYYIEPYSNELWIILIILILLLVYKNSNLLFQYLISTSILFLYSPLYGILYANLIFYIYNFQYFLQINNIFNKITLLSNLIISIIIIFLHLFNLNYYSYITLPILNICTVMSNLYFLFYIKQITCLV